MESFKAPRKESVRDALAQLEEDINALRENEKHTRRIGERSEADELKQGLQNLKRSGMRSSLVWVRSH